ncbi:DinI-like family protein [Escherichia coli]|nr:DinI-like family protein [Escherichia coli]ELP2945295.1 DinI-like family protein [Escherichia coli O76]ELT1935380.1 DinI-like family protein [Shigella sonnei]EHJ7320056.1 DinI-like family protein [Escherichia coli]EHL3190671.1 DinI-like family protein [Escherichia coli]
MIDFVKVFFVLQRLIPPYSHSINNGYDHVDVIVRTTSNDGLTILRVVNKESAHEFVQETLQEAWETAEDCFIQ